MRRLSLAEDELSKLLAEVGEGDKARQGEGRRGQGTHGGRNYGRSDEHPKNKI